MKLRALVLFLVVIASLGLVLIPAILIQPFAPQTPSQIDVAYRLRSVSPLVTLVLGFLGLVSIGRLWHRTRLLAKPALVMAGLLLAAAAFLSRQNHFEWMFRPLPHPGFAEVADAKFVDDGDMVLVVQTGGETKAYPVRLMAYHHVVNDVVGGDPVVVTY